MNGGYMMIDFKGYDISYPVAKSIPGLKAKLEAAAKYGKPVMCYNLKKSGVAMSAIPNCVDANGNLIFSDFAINVDSSDNLTAGTSAIGIIANMTSKNMSPSSGATVGAAGNVVNNADIALPAGDYIMSLKSSATTAGFELKTGSTRIAQLNNVPADTTKSVKFTLASAITKYTLYSNAATTVSELMIRPACISDPTFVAYAPTSAVIYAAATT